MKKTIWSFLLMGACLEEETKNADTSEQQVEDIENPDDQGLVGSWQIDSVTYGSIVASFDDDGMYEVEFDSGNPEAEVWGPYSVDGTVLTMSEHDEGMYACHVPGTYDMVFNSETVVFTKIEDDCTGRSSMVGGVWTRVN